MTYISPMMFNESSIQRRQTARESTGPLKGWLQEHPRNPYPTKAEKVMLALISGLQNPSFLTPVIECHATLYYTSTLN